MSPLSRRIMPFVCLAAAIMCMLLPSACSRSSRQPELRRLDREANDAMARFADRSTDSLAALLLDRATRAGDRTYQGKAHFYLSKFYWDLDSATVARKLSHLDQAEAIARETGNDTLLAYIYNQRGVWELSQNLAPVTARYWFNRSIETATPLGERWISIPAENNMSESCRISGDTIGIQYDRELFDYAVRSRQPELMWASGLHCAVYYAMTASDTAVLNPYLDAVDALPDYSRGIRQFVYAIYFFNKGEYGSAAKLMEEADPTRYRDFRVFYAEILNRLGRFDESDSWLAANDTAPGVIFSDSEVRAVKAKALNAAGSARWSDAYRWQRVYEGMRDSIDDSNSRDLSRRYKVEYEVNIKDRQILDQTRRLKELHSAIAWSLALVLVIIASLCIYIWKRRGFYRDIVRQNIDFIARQKDYEERLAACGQRADTPCAAETPQPDTPDEPLPKAPDSRLDGIFNQIRSLAEEKQVWRDVNITRDSFADMVGCNRTYFTEAIKSHAGMSYTQYMNSCRIREAVKVLSDPADDTPLKDLSASLGFLTLASFYAGFKKETGMSPAAFRKTARDLAGGAHASEPEA